MTQVIQDLLEQYFDCAFTTLNGITRLRELILALAMQGKLVAQDANDSSAEELLKVIDEEKQHLVVIKKIKKPKSLSPIQQSEQPYKLPEGWVWTRLGTIGNIFNGNSINADEKENNYVGANGLPYIATKDIGYGFDLIDYNNGIYIPESEKKFKIARKDAVLICAEGGSAGKKCGIAEQDIYFGNKLFANELFGGISPKFILYLYLSPVFKNSFNAAMTGIIGGVSIARFMELQIPLPSLNEQQRIVEKLDQLMARCDDLKELRDKREKNLIMLHSSAIKNLIDIKESTIWPLVQEYFGNFYTIKKNVTELRKAILNLAIMGRFSVKKVGDEPVSKLLDKLYSERNSLNLKELAIPNDLIKFTDIEIPKHWKWQCLGNLLVYGPKNGISPRSVDYETDVRSLTLSATTSGIFKGEHTKFIDIKIPEDSDLWLNDGDILVQRGNTLEYVGVPAIYKGKSGIFIYPDLMMKIRVSHYIDIDYIYYVMSSEPARQYLRSHASGTAGTMPKINQKNLNSLPIPVPPIEEQRRIANTVSRLLNLCDLLDQKIELAANKQHDLLDAVMAKI